MSKILPNDWEKWREAIKKMKSRNVIESFLLTWLSCSSLFDEDKIICLGLEKSWSTAIYCKTILLKQKYKYKFTLKFNSFTCSFTTSSISRTQTRFNQPCHKLKTSFSYFCMPEVLFDKTKTALPKTKKGFIHC